MAFIRIKMIKGNPYYYEQESYWKDGRVKTKHVRYIGKSLNKLKGDKASKKDNILNKDNLKTVPQKPGVYYLYNRKGDLIYIGAGERLRHRISAHYQENNHLEPDEQKLHRNAHYYRWRGAKTKEDAWELEKKEVRHYDPKYNRYKDGDKSDNPKR